MADAKVVEFLNKVKEDKSLRARAKSTYTSEGVEGLVRLADEQGDKFSAKELESVISPETLSDVSIGWG